MARPSSASATFRSGPQHQTSLRCILVENTHFPNSTTLCVQALPPSQATRAQAGRSTNLNEWTVFQEVLVIRVELRHDHVEVPDRCQPCPATQAQLAAIDHQDLAAGRLHHALLDRRVLERGL